MELLDGLQIRDSIDIVGLSFGGATATNFTARYPARVRRVALISPLVYDYPIPAWVHVPVIGEFLGRLIGVRIVVERANALSESTTFAQHYAALFAEQISYEGFQSSLLSMLRHDALTDYRDSYAAVGRQNRRVLLIWGMRDTDVTEKMISAARARIPRVEFHAVQGAGHGIVFQNPEQVQTLLIDFLRGVE